MEKDKFDSPESICSVLLVSVRFLYFAKVLCNLPELKIKS